jgi:hypothetical protein
VFRSCDCRVLRRWPDCGNQVRRKVARLSAISREDDILECNCRGCSGFKRERARSRVSEIQRTFACTSTKKTSGDIIPARKTFRWNEPKRSLLRVLIVVHHMPSDQIGTTESSILIRTLVTYSSYHKRKYSVLYCSFNVFSTTITVKLQLPYPFLKNGL